MVNKNHSPLDEVACYRRWFHVVRPRVFSKMVGGILALRSLTLKYYVHLFQNKDQRKQLDAEMLSVSLFPTEPFGVVRSLWWRRVHRANAWCCSKIGVPKIRQVSCDSALSQNGCANKNPPIKEQFEPIGNRIDLGDSTFHRTLSKQVLVLDAEVILKAHKFVPLRPQSIADALSCSPLPAERYYFWWRAIAAAYMIRPNLVNLFPLFFLLYYFTGHYCWQVVNGCSILMHCRQPLNCSKRYEIPSCGIPRAEAADSAYLRMSAMATKVLRCDWSPFASTGWPPWPYSSDRSLRIV